MTVVSDGTPRDTVDGRIGEWIHTSLGKRFWPADPRPEEVFISDIANGLALDVRYAGQGRVDRYYSVAEHSVHMAGWAYNNNWEYKECLAVLLHDAPEAYINDLSRAVKRAVGAGYKRLENKLADVIYRRFGVRGIMRNQELRDRIKDLDCRIVPLEKAAIMAYPQPWAYDTFEPLDGVTIRCWDPKQAKIEFLQAYGVLSERAGLPIQEWRI